MTSSAQNSKQSLAQQGSATVPAYSFLGDQDTGIYRSGANELSIATNGTQRAVVDSSGNVGIGTASPIYNLQVNAASGDVTLGVRSASVGAALTRLIGSTSTYAAYNALISQQGDTSAQHWYIGGNGVANTLTFQTNGANERMRISSGGAVSIGGTATDGLLNIAGDTYFKKTSSAYNALIAGTATVSGYLGSYNSSGTRIGYNSYWNGTEYIAAWTDSTTPIVFGTNGSERMRISGAGRVSIGASLSTIIRFFVTGETSANTNYTIYTQNSNGSTNFFARDDGFIAFGLAPNFTTGSAANVYMDGSGGIYMSTSSIRYKRDVTDYTRTLNDLMKLRPVFFKGKSENDGDTQFAGLIAEEVHEAGLTEFVVYNKDSEPNALNYGNMVALLIKAVQDQQKTIQGLSARIAAIEPA